MLFIVLLQDEVMSASLFPMAPAAYIDILKRSFLFFFFFLVFLASLTHCSDTGVLPRMESK